MNTAEYLNSTVWCRLGVSPIHGVGVFAIRDIPKGQQITDYNYSNIKDGVPLLECDEDEFAQVNDDVKSLVLDRMLYDASIGSRLKFVSPNHDQCLQSFMNHADDPNTDGLTALRDITKGEEITEDFRQLFDEPHHLTKKHHNFLWKTTPSQGVESQESPAIPRKSQSQSSADAEVREHCSESTTAKCATGITSHTKSQEEIGTNGLSRNENAETNYGKK